MYMLIWISKVFQNQDIVLCACNLQESTKFKYIISEPVKKKPSSGGASAKKTAEASKTKTKREEYKEAMRDHQIQWIPKMESCVALESRINCKLLFVCVCVRRLEDSKTLYKEVTSVYPDHLPLHHAWLQHLDSESQGVSLQHHF